jgi:hypothetical protein
MTPKPHNRSQALTKLREMHVCIACQGPHVQPVEWREAPGSSWEVELRCPECENRVHDVYTQREIDEYDRHLDEGCQALVADLRHLTQENMEIEARHFAAALAADLILPEDF